jgi:hypothetical protein
VLDSVDKIPPVHCEASDLLRIPPLSLDPVDEQVNCNSQSLKTLAGAVERLEKRLTSFLDSSASSATGLSQLTYATVASSDPPPQVPSLSPGSVKKNTTLRPATLNGRESNLILFGLPKEAKKTVDEVFEFLSGKQVQIKDIFRLGWFKKPIFLSTSSSSFD